MGRSHAISVLIFGAAGCLSPDRLEPDLSAPGTYVLVESGPDEARALVIDTPRFVYTPSFEDSALEVHRFSCPPAWYGFSTDGKMQLVTTTVAAARNLLAAGWPAPDAVQLLEGEGGFGTEGRWAFEPSLETTPITSDATGLPAGAPISASSGCEGSTAFFASGEGVFLVDERIQPLSFPRAAIAAMPLNEGTFWTVLQEAGPTSEDDSLVSQTPVFAETSTPTTMRGVIRMASQGPVGVRVSRIPESSDFESTLLRVGRSDGVGASGDEKPDDTTLPTIVENGPNAFVIAQGGRAGVQFGGPESWTPPVFSVAEASGRLFALISANAQERRRLGRFGDDSLTVSAVELGCDPGIAPGDPEPIRLDTFRGLLVVAWSDRLVVRSAFGPVCRVARFSAGSDPATIAVSSALIAWGAAGPVDVVLETAGSM